MIAIKKLLKKWKNRRLKKKIIAQILSNPNHCPGYETTVLIAYDIISYIKNDLNDDSERS